MAKLTAAARNKLPNSAFADPVHRAYPMQDAGHRQAAMGMVQKYGTSKQKEQVAARANRSYGGNPLGQ